MPGDKLNIIDGGKSFLIVAVGALVLLAPTVFFHVSSDLAIFVRGGEVLASGGALYQDFVDLKPPLIYYIFAPIAKISGDSEIVLRLFDLALQLFTALSIYFLVKKKADITSAVVASLIYSMSYAALNFNQTMQSGSFAAAVFVAALIFETRADERGRPADFALSGIMIGLLIGLKFTLGAIVFAVLFYDVFSRRKSLKDFFRDNSYRVIGCVGAFAATFFPVLINPGTREGFVDVLNYLSVYSQFPPADFNLIISLIDKGSVFFGAHFSLLATALLGFGLYRYFKLEKGSKETAFLDFVVVSAGFLFLSIIIEKKMHGYHFLRIYPALAILAGIGIKPATDAISKFWKRGVWAVISLVFLAGLVMFYGPGARWLGVVRYPIYYFTDRASYDSLNYDPESSALLRPEHEKVAEYLNSHAEPFETMSIVSVGSKEIYFFLDNKNITRFSQSCFVLGVFPIEDWREGFVADLQKSDWIVVQDNDVHKYIFGHEKSSFEALQNYSKAYKILEDYFEEVERIGNFLIFKRVEAKST